MVWIISLRIEWYSSFRKGYRMMLGAYYRGNVKFSMEEIEVPKPKANEVKIKIMANSVCNSTDRKIITGLRDDVIGVNRILGHESGGVVEEVGELVTEFRVGDRVATEAWGTYTEYICTTEDMCQHVPDSLSWDEIALSEIVMKVYQMAAGNVIPGDTVVIFGQGAAGLIFTQLAKLSGASKIIVTDLYDVKLEKAKSYGADVAINADKAREEVLADISEALGDRTADVIIEAAGVVETAAQALRVPNTYGAKILQFGVLPAEVSYSFTHLHDCGQQVVTIGACKFVDEHLPYRRSIQLIAEGKVEVQSLSLTGSSLKISTKPSTW